MYTHDQVKQMIRDRIFNLVAKYADYRTSAIQDVQRDINEVVDEILYFT